MNLLLTGCFQYTQEHLARLTSLGYDISFMQQEKDCLPIPAKEIDAVVCNGLFLTHDISTFERLSLIQLTSAGLDRVPLDYIKTHGIRLCNARGVYGIPMAEWVLFRLLEHYKNARHFYHSQLTAEWIKERGLEEVYGKKACIIGAGNVGSEVAKRLKAMGCHVIGYDVFHGTRDWFDNIMDINSIHNSLSSFDIIVLTAPYTKETRHILNVQTLALLKKHAVIVNIARGGLIDEVALCNFLRGRQDVFAILDVFEQEPLPKDSPLWKMPNAAISPHNSFVSSGNQERMFKVIERNLKEWISAN